MKKIFRAHRLSELHEQQGILVNPYLKMARQPRDSSDELHRLADAWFEQQFDLGFRSKTLFGSGDRSEAKLYCDEKHVLISIEPIDDYVLCYSPKCRDMFDHFQRVGCHPWHQDFVWQEMNSLQYQLVNNTSWDAAATSNCEIMMYAQKFKYRRED